ncbi:nucleoid-associated protein, YbaB/EbfC family [Malaciobacter halophilus]|uniref:Nucleoid-associated protein CP960_11230 n=1 Tax=Malaciobacter halophilus TaxID=197482 RepID=A0A2N1J0K9_9BACT|nr:YbaB/EbfC family nucleoid-associated protein [Malaciobacter halophilus]AXH08912.1 YbaB/EbfC DNA-binding family protein [Malaciobacter halophilus]PKI80071.1 nucleoid-associated protein, YbaB/EbfC family [Malaciobacter halophilus]
MFDGIDLSKLNLNEMMSQVQDMANQAKEENASKVFTSKAGGGMVEISINGNSEIIDLKIDDSLLEDKDSLQILLISCINDVIKQSDENKKMMAMNMMGGMGSFGQKS